MAFENGGPQGDMLIQDYDETLAVANAGGIPGWCPRVIIASGTAPEVTEGAVLLLYEA